MTTDRHCLDAETLAAWLDGGLDAAGVAAIVVVACVVLTFVPMRWAHPMRTPVLWPLTLAAMLLWAAAAFLALWGGFPASGPAQVVLAGVAAYGIGLTLLRSRLG